MALWINLLCSAALALLLPALRALPPLSAERWPLRLGLGLLCFAALQLASSEHWYDRRTRRLASVPGLLFGCFLAWGAALESTGQIPWSSPLFHLEALLLIPFCSAVTALLWRLLPRAEAAMEKKGGGKGGFFRKTWLVWLLILLCWLPCFLAIFPGNFVYDTGGEYDQCAFGYNSAFPRLHSWLDINVIHGVYGLTGSFTAGVAVFTLLHMLGLSLLFAWILRRLRDTGLRPWLLWLSLGYFALFPTVQMLAVSPIRDLMFSGFLSAFVFLLLLLLRSGRAFWRSRDPLLLGLSLALTLLSRNNNSGVLILLLLFGAVGLILSRAGKGCRRGAVIFALAALGGYFGLNAALTAACQPFEQVHVVSSLAPLIQPVARSYEEDAWEDWETERFREYFDTEQFSYTANDGDMAIAAFRGFHSGEEGAAGFVRLWLALLRQHPGTFLEAWLENTRGLWMPGAVLDGYVRSGRYQGMETAYYYYTDQITGPGELNILLPQVHAFYESIGTRMSFERIPVLREIFSIGFYFWLLLFAMFYWGWRRQRRLQWAFCPLTLYAVLSAFCPLMLVRYFAALFFCFPPLLCAILQSGRLSEGEEP